MENIKQLIGIRYKSNGRDFNKGLDCWGLVYQFSLMHGKNIPKLEGYYSNSENEFEVEETVIASKSDFRKINYEQRAYGDILLFRLKNRPVHVGIILDNKKMLHTLSGHNSCVESYSDVVWGNRIEGIYRWES